VKQKANPPTETGHLGTAAEVAPLIPILPVTLLKLARDRKIPCIRLGYRTVLFNAEKVRTALQKFEVQAIR
jgi:hypothetical protein